MARAGQVRDPKQTPTDVAYEVLLQRGVAMHYKDLLAEILPEKGQQSPADAGRLIASILTDINLDSRFVHVGQGRWALRRWSPKQKEAKLPSLVPVGRDLRRRKDYALLGADADGDADADADDEDEDFVEDAAAGGGETDADVDVDVDDDDEGDGWDAEEEAEADSEDGEPEPEPEPELEW